MIPRIKNSLSDILACPLCGTERVEIKTGWTDSLVCPKCDPARVEKYSCAQTKTEETKK